MMTMMMKRPLLWLTALSLLVAACADTPGVAPEPAADTPAAEDLAPTPDQGIPDTGPELDPVEEGWSITTHPVGEGACCLSLTADRMVWAEDGDIFMVTVGDGVVEILIDHEGVQKDPVLSGDRVVWADDRAGDFDLYALDLSTGIEEAVVTAPGDQVAPSLDGDRLVWVGFPAVDVAASLSEIWTLDLSSGEQPLQLTDDSAEQSFPHVSGSRVVWTDFRNDPDGQYMDPQGTAENNGDIFGHDLALGEPFVVTEHPAKQLRPAIDGDTVVWLDWRDKPEGEVGIGPEPKYHHFTVYVRSLPEGEEIFLEVGGWQQPELWRRPGIHQGYVAWITDVGQVAPAQTSIRISELATGESTLVHDLDGVLVGLDFRDSTLGWIGGGQVGVMPFVPPTLDRRD